MKPDEVIYEKVLIKDEKDLPKEYLRLISHYKGEENVFYRIYEPPYNSDEMSFIIENIDWYLRPTSLRDVLKDFNSFMCGKQYDGRIPLIDTCIDEYINSKQ